MLDWMLRTLVGQPDYGIALYLGPWPDGGWCASLCLTSREYVEEQAKDAAGDLARTLRGVLTLDENYDASLDIVNGFGQPPHGITVYGATPHEATVVLFHAVIARAEAAVPMT